MQFIKTFLFNFILLYFIGEREWEHTAGVGAGRIKGRGTLSAERGALCRCWIPRSLAHDLSRKQTDTSPAEPPRCPHENLSWWDYNKAVHLSCSWRFQSQDLHNKKAKRCYADLNIMETRRMLKYGPVSVCTQRSLVHVDISLIGSTFCELMLYSWMTHTVDKMPSPPRSVNSCAYCSGQGAQFALSLCYLNSVPDSPLKCTIHPFLLTWIWNSDAFLIDFQSRPGMLLFVLNRSFISPCFQNLYHMN